MLTFLLHQSWFFVALLGLFFVPGWLLLRAAFDRSRFTMFEWTVLSAVVSLGLLIFSMLALDAVHVRFTPAHLAATMIAESAVFTVLSAVRTRRSEKPQKTFLQSGLSGPSAISFLIIAFLTVFVKTVYLTEAGVPSSTDLGHHMYWVTLMADTGSIPTYVERNIVDRNGDYALDDPKPIADFIVGEHLPFAALSILAGKDVVSSFPIVTLFLVNLLSILALFALAWRLSFGPNAGTKTPVRTALLTILLVGPLYALSSPQAKFVSGGVIGNTFGNLFIPVLLLTYYRALKEHDPRLLALGFFLTFTLAYVHHLSTFVLLFVLAAIAAWSLLAGPRDAWPRIRSWTSLAFRPAPLLVAGLAIAFFLFVAIPSYANPSAIGTAVGNPTKDTRTGLSLLQLGDSMGHGRLGIGLAGLVVLVFSRSRARYSSAFLVGWGTILLVMTLRPDWLLVDIPSNRISTYAIFPLTLVAATIISRISGRMIRNWSGSATPIGPFAIPLLAVFFVSTVSAGYFDDARSLLGTGKDQEAVQTFAAARYLAERTTESDGIIKDHNYITADSWMKVFFLRGYDYPLSRGYFKRYEDGTNPREQCTLRMISTPNTVQGQKCFTDTGTDFVVVNPAYDTAQFRKSSDFSLVYASDDISVYHRDAD